MQGTCRKDLQVISLFSLLQLRNEFFDKAWCQIKTVPLLYQLLLITLIRLQFITTREFFFQMSKQREEIEEEVKFEETEPFCTEMIENFM